MLISKNYYNKEISGDAEQFIKDYMAYPSFYTPDICVLPGFCDVHVHFREPGFSYKETIKTGSIAAAHGGYTSVCTMPNLNPTPDSVENVLIQKKIIDDDACINVYPIGTITKSEMGRELSDIADMSDLVIAFSDDGRGVQNSDMMEKAMNIAKENNKPICAHCEDNSLLNGGYIHDGVYARENGHRGICSKSEWGPIERDIELAKKTGCAYHVCHISCKESVELIRNAKKDGVNITCETGPHYLVLDESDLQENGRFKMNPPLRSKEDKEALIEGIKDGTIDMIATDHAPHSAEEKSKGLEKSAFGIVGIETAFQIMYSEFVKTNIISMERLIELLCVNPKKRLGITDNNSYSVWDLGIESEINSDEFLSKGKSTPFEGKNVFGKCLLTVCNGKIVYKSV